MGLSGLFEDYRVKVATGVSWFYAGEGGGFEYWPQGPAAASVVHEGAMTNTAIVADNDFMWHRVRPTGRAENGMLTLTTDAELVRRDGQTWAIVDGGEERASFPFEQVRVSLSWKGIVFSDDEDRRRHDEHLDDIALADVVERFATDLSARGIDIEVPRDPLQDAGFIRALSDVYVHYPAT
jgi:hypothetical protein